MVQNRDGCSLCINQGLGKPGLRNPENCGPVSNMRENCKDLVEITFHSTRTSNLQQIQWN